MTTAQKKSEFLLHAENALGIGPVAMAQAMATKYPTYKDWRSGRRPMPDVARRCIELLLEKANVQLPPAPETDNVITPILRNHDKNKAPIGTVDFQDGKICFRFSQPIPKHELFEIFGNAGIRMTETEDRDGELFVTAGEILEFSA